MITQEKMRGTVKFVNELGKTCEYFGTVQLIKGKVLGSSTRQQNRWEICNSEQVTSFKPLQKSLTNSN